MVDSRLRSAILISQHHLHVQYRHAAPGAAAFQCWRRNFLVASPPLPSPPPVPPPRPCNDLKHLQRPRWRWGRRGRGPGDKFRSYLVGSPFSREPSHRRWYLGLGDTDCIIRDAAAGEQSHTRICRSQLQRSSLSRITYVQ